MVAQLVGTPSAPRPDVYRDTSVPRLFPFEVPTDLVNGRDDAIVPVRLAADYVAGSRGTARLHIVPNTGHVELIAPGTAAWDVTNALVKRAVGC